MAFLQLPNNVPFVSHIGRLLPEHFKELARAALRRQILRSAIERIAKSPTGQIPEEEILRGLTRGWGNEGYSAPLKYLQEVSRRVLSLKGHVLECGTGVTTILMGLLAGSRGITIWSLEHDAIWYERIRKVLNEYHITSVKLYLVPLNDNGKFSWYAFSSQDMPQSFALVVCDGPPQQTTRGGRYGLLPVMKDKLSRDSVILMDDAIPQAATIGRWKQEFGVHVSLVNDGEHTFAAIQTP